MISGLPALPFGVSVAVSIPPLVSDLLNLLTGFAASPWGIFLDGVSVVQADSVVSINYKQDWSLSDFPVEEGGFETYDKVNTPFNSRVRFASGGDQSNRAALLDSIAAIAGDLNLYDVVTPEAVYSSVNIQGYSLMRTATNGVGLIQVEVQLLEIRVTATSQYTQSPTSADTLNTGTVQPQPYTGPNLGPLQGTT